VIGAIDSQGRRETAHPGGRRHAKTKEDSVAKLKDLAQLIRSKNAGMFELTVDVLFTTQETYEQVAASGVINEATISRLFNVPAEDVKVFHYAPARAIKASFPRRVPVGHPADTDIFGGQQFAGLARLEVPGAEPDHVPQTQR
jgi:hypothetical protein